MEFDIVRFLNGSRGGVLDTLSLVLCSIPVLSAFWLLCVGLAVYLDRKYGARLAAAVALALAVHFLVNEGLLKHALLTFFPMRIRPYLADPADIVPLGVQFHDSSFPSSHAASSAAVLTVLTSRYRSMWPFALTFLVAMALARMHCGMHYPSDVLTGSALGMAYGALALAVIRRKGATTAAPEED
jgi:undecaprenyl-diphosphatase